MFVGPQGLIGQGGHGEVVMVSLPQLGLVALKGLQTSDPHSRRELEVVRVCVAWCEGVWGIPSPFHPLPVRVRGCGLILSALRVSPSQAAKLRAHPHNNIIAMHTPWTTGDMVYLPMALADTDLYASVELEGALPEAHARSLFRQLVSALQHMHALGVYHGDVKPENVLVLGGEARLADFGGAAFTRLSRRPCATVQYGSPEAVAAHRACSAGRAGDSPVVDAALGDVWGLGVSLLVALTTYMPWESAEESDGRYAHWVKGFVECVDGELPVELARRMFLGEEESEVSSCLLSLVAGMLHPNPGARLTMEQVAAHPWFHSSP